MKKFINLNFAPKIFEFEKSSESQEREIVNLMFSFDNLKKDLEDLYNILPLVAINLSNSKHTRTLTDSKPAELLNESYSSVLNTSIRSYSSINKFRMNPKANSSTKKELAVKENFGIFSPKVSINISENPANIPKEKLNLNEIRTILYKIIDPTMNVHAKPSIDLKTNTFNITNRQTSNLTNSKNNYPTTPQKNENLIKKIEIPATNSIKSLKEDPKTLNKKLKNNSSNCSNKSTKKNSAVTSSKTLNKFLTNQNEKRPSNKNITDEIKRINYKLEPKKILDTNKKNVGKLTNLNDLENHPQKSLSLFKNNSNESNSVRILNELSRNCSNPFSNDQDKKKDENESINYTIDKIFFFKNPKNKIIFTNIFSFLNIKNKLKNMNKILRLSFIEVQMMKIKKLLKEKNQKIEEAKLFNKSNVLELILEMEILSHRESKMKTFLNHYIDH